ncbi:MAG: hypothetical protein B7Z73_08360 [Planctomycetia bacterium 21-64-5]|nr:MAG: hypothetical protein B7Z73_08360 [Planctomycetia bacterium 21-64-5]HQU41981.1 hypothetical protein [Pirellulales bacterium]
MRVTVLASVFVMGILPAAVVSAQVPGNGGIGLLSPNVGTAGQQDMTPGATVTGVGPGGGMRGGQVPEAIGANWTTTNFGDRSMGATITGTGQFARGSMSPGVGSNFTTVNGQDRRPEAGAVNVQFGQPNQRLPYGPGANINTAGGRDLGLEHAAINGGASALSGGGWRMNGLAPPGVGSNMNTVPAGNLGPENVTAAPSVNARLGENRWPYQQAGGRTWARGTVTPAANTGYHPQVYAQWLSTQNQTGYSGIPPSSGWAGHYGNRFFGSGINGTTFTNYGSGYFGNGFYGNSFPANAQGANASGFTPSGFNGNGWNPGAMNAGFVPSGVNGGGWIPSGFNGNAFVPSASNANGFIPSGYNGNGG